MWQGHRMALGMTAGDLFLVPGSGAWSRWYLPYGGLSSGRSLQARLDKIRGRRQGLFSEAEDGVREECSMGYGERVAGGAGRGQTPQGPLRHCQEFRFDLEDTSRRVL